MTKLIGLLLIVIGVAGFFLREITWTETDKVDLGVAHMEIEHEEGFPVTPVAAGVAVIAGIVLVVIGSKEKKA